MLDALTCTHGEVLVQPALRGLTTLLSYADAMEVNELQLELVLSFIKQHLNDPPLGLAVSLYFVRLCRVTSPRRSSTSTLWLCSPSPSADVPAESSPTSPN
jgi:hypothetical protein